MSLTLGLSRLPISFEDRVAVNKIKNVEEAADGIL